MCYKATADMLDAETPGLTASEKLVLVLLAHYSNSESGRCFPSTSSLARSACVKPQQVIRIIASLEHKGALIVTRKQGHANEYQLLPYRAPVPSRAPLPYRAVNQCPTGHPTPALQGTLTEKEQSIKSEYSPEPFFSTASEPKTKKAKPPKPERPRNELFDALSEICGMDPKLNGGRIGKESAELAKAGYSATDVRTFGWWWTRNDFRGKQGQRPTLGQVREHIAKSKRHAAPLTAPASAEPQDILEGF